MALSAPQFTYFTDKIDIMEPDITAIRVSLASVDTKLTTLATAIADLETAITAGLGSVDTNVNATVSTIGATNTVLDKIRQKLVGLRSG